MNISYYHEPTWYEGAQQITQFAKFDYQYDVDVFGGESWQWICDLAFEQLVREVQRVKNRTAYTIDDSFKLTLLLKIPVLWHDWQKDRRWRQPLVIGPDNNPHDGYGRILIGILDPDVRFDILRYENKDGGIEEAHRLIDILVERSKPKDVKLIDVYYLEHNGLPFSRQVDFLKSKPYVQDYCGEWFIDIYRRWKDSLWLDMVKLIDDATLECDDDYRDLVKAFCSMPFEHVESGHLAY